MVQLIQRALRVFLLDSQVFEAVGADEDATSDAAIIVTVVAIVGAIAAAISAALFSVGFGLVNTGLGIGENILGDIGFRLPIFNPVGAFFKNFVGVYVAWFLWALTTYVVGSLLFKGDAGFGEMLRILGFAQVPRILSGLGFIPGIGWLPGLVGWIWSLVASFVGIRQGLKFTTGRTILTVALSVIVVLLANLFIVNPILDRIF